MEIKPSEEVSKLLDLHIGLVCRDSEIEGCAIVLASTPTKMGVRLEQIRERYPNASIIEMHEEFGTGFYTVKINSEV